MSLDAIIIEIRNSAFSRKPAALRSSSLRRSKPTSTQATAASFSDSHSGSVNISSYSTYYFIMQKISAQHFAYFMMMRQASREFYEQYMALSEFRLKAWRSYKAASDAHATEARQWRETAIANAMAHQLETKQAIKKVSAYRSARNIATANWLKDVRAQNGAAAHSFKKAENMAFFAARFRRKIHEQKVRSKLYCNHEFTHNSTMGYAQHEQKNAGASLP